jgi:hypothetical protein
MPNIKLTTKPRSNNQSHDDHIDVFSRIQVGTIRKCVKHYITGGENVYHYEPILFRFRSSGKQAFFDTVEECLKWMKEEIEDALLALNDAEEAHKTLK